MAMRALVQEDPVEEARARLRLVKRRTDEAPLVSVRTCTSCGEHTAFVRDPDGCWYACVACGRYA
jgi:ribosomal protein S14